MVNTLNAGNRLYPGQSITSSDGRYILEYQNDGNLVLHTSAAVPFWDSETWGDRVGYCIMQTDGNLVLVAQDHLHIQTFLMVTF